MAINIYIRLLVNVTNFTCSALACAASAVLSVGLTRSGWGGGGFDSLTRNLCLLSD